MKALKLFIISLLLTGCATETLKPIELEPIVYKWKTYDCGVPPSRDHIDLTWADGWIVNAEGLWTLTPEHYAILGENIADIITGSNQLKELVMFYEKCIEVSKGLIENERNE